MGDGPRLRLRLTDAGAGVGPHRARRRDVRRRARRHDRGPGRASQIHEPARAPGLVAVAAQARMAKRRRRACVLGRGSGFAARAAVRGRLVRRAREMAPCGGDLGHAAVRPSARRASAPDRHDDAAADPAAEPLSRRSDGRGVAGADRRQCRESGAGLSRHGRRPLRRHAPRPPGTRRRDDRGSSGRAVDARRRSRRCASMRAPPLARIVVAVDPPASSTARRCLRHRRRGRRRGGRRLRARGRDRAGPEAASLGGERRGALSAP